MCSSLDGGVAQIAPINAPTAESGSESRKRIGTSQRLPSSRAVKRRDP